MDYGLDTTFDILKLVEFSSKHGNRFEKVNQELSPMHFPGLRALSSRFVQKVYKVFWTITLSFWLCSVI